MSTEEGLPGRNLGAYLTGYPVEVAFGADDAAEVFDRYHTPDFVLYNDGTPLDREKLLAHVRPARRRATSVHIELHETLVSGDRVAARYILTAVMVKGTVIATEIYMFGQLAEDGRLRRIDQLTRLVPAPAVATGPAVLPPR
ncbi:nuclear transport factor 2 family protein [Plantactinospora sp. S1510]|uniref:Nuclear transport factor 2 family protein n=1 Tax=Plantactinospora alkalitolerans TaxID=2789879 RepID=A0ABS0H0J3_9ACTN|nr:nuclear transport factor 2 family protein [Plantactinospora alkalitolerans]MBF9131981.1 nuclear transport factor 2 family protein [Plantactinospora alkalitolerans]